jgi:N-methylhydantoinase A
MRYVGQEHTLSVPMAGNTGAVTASCEEILSLFKERYRRTFGGLLEVPAEIVSMRATLRRPLPRRSERPGVPVAPGEPAFHEAFSFVLQRRVPFKILRRDVLSPGAQVAGPAIINESTATTYVDANYTAVSDASGCLFISPVTAH